jgi:hypothetical protein
LVISLSIVSYPNPAIAILRLAGLFVLSMHSHGTGESGTRARLAFRTLVRCHFLWQVRIPRLLELIVKVHRD